MMMPEMLCSNHSGVYAVAVCAVCGAPVCGDCAVTLSGTTFCNDRTHAEIFASCRLLGRSETMFDAELIAKNLEVHTIKSYWFGPAVDRTSERFALFVPTEQHIEAEAMLRSLDLIDFITLGDHVR
jgi:hypothetical protein